MKKLLALILLLLCAAVAASADDAVFTVQNAERMTMQEFRFDFSVPGADRVHMHEGNDWSSWQWETAGSEGYFTPRLYNSGDYTFHLWGQFDGDWREVADPITVTATAPHGELVWFNADCVVHTDEGQTATIGHDVAPYHEYVTRFWTVDGLDGYDEGSSYDNDGRVTENNTGTHISGLQGGRVYEAWVWDLCQGYEGSRHAAFITVGDSNSGLAVPNDGHQVFLFADDATVNTFTDIHLTAMGHGAESVKLFVSHNDGYLNDEFESDGDRYFQQYSWRHPGTYTVAASACFDGVWTDPEDCKFTVTVSNPYGSLPAPTVSMAAQTDPGQDVFIDFSETANAAHYSFWMSDAADENDQYVWGDGCTADENTPYPLRMRIPGYVLQPGHSYHIYLDVNAPGYTEGHDDRTLTVNSASAPYLYIENTSPTTMEQVHVAVSAPGAERIRFSSGYGDWWDEDGWEGEWWTDSFSHDYWADPDVTVRAEAMYNGQWQLVDEQTVSMYSAYGEMPGPDEYHLAHCLTAGEDLTVGLSLPGEASFWDVTVTDVDSGEQVCGAWRIYESREVTFSADNFESGREYRVNFQMCGYGYNSWRASELLYVQDDTSAVLLLSKTDDVEVLESITAVVSAPGAERIRFSSGYGNWWDEDGWEGDLWSTEGVCWDYWADPDVTVRAEAMYNGQWQLVGEQHVHMIASHGEMPAPDYSISQRIDDELTVSVILPEYAAYCDVNVREGDTYLHRDRLDESGTLTYPASEFETGALYTVELHLCGWGYNAWHTGETVVRSGGYNEDIQLTVNDEDGYLQVPVNTNVNAVVTAPANATAILTWGGYNWQWRYTNNVEDNHKVLRFDDWYFGEGELSLMARYTTDDLDYGEDIDRYTWSGLSNVVALSAYATGAATEASVTLADNDLTRGDTFSFTVDNLDQFNGLSWNIHDEQYDGWVFDEWRWVSFEGEGSTTATFEEDTTFWYTDQEEAHFSLCTVANGFSGETNTTTWHDITLRAQVGAEPQFSAPASVAQGEDVVITILNPEDGMNWHAWIWENDNQHEYRYWDGVDTIRVPTNQIPANETVQLYVAHDGKAGYAGADKGVDLQVTGQITDPVIHTDKEYYATGETFEIIAYAPGASGVALSLYHEGETDPFAQNQEENGDTLWFYWSDGGVHEIRIEMTATYPDGSTKTASDTINTFAPYGQLDTPTVTASRMQQQGWFMEFDVDRHGGEWWWTVEVQDNSDNVIAHWDKNTSGDETHFGFDTANLLGSYHIFVYASQQGYSDTWVNFDFEVVENLVIATLPSALTEIEEEAFEGADFQWVVIPQSVTYIGSRAFANCSNLQAIIILGQPTIEEDAFAGGVASRTFFAAENSDIWSWLLNHGCWVEPLSYAGY